MVAAEQQLPVNPAPATPPTRRSPAAMSRKMSKSDDEDQDVDMLAGLTPLEVAKRAGNINIAEEDEDVMDLPETMAEGVREQQDRMRQIQLARKARAVVVPTNDLKVRRRLRELGEPITLFGENIPGRRERLRAVLSKLILEGHTEAARIQEEEVRREEEEQTGGPVRDKAYLMPGRPELAAARLWLAERSVARSQARLQAERQEVEEWRRAAYAYHRASNRRRHGGVGRGKSRNDSGDAMQQDDDDEDDNEEDEEDDEDLPLDTKKEAVETYRLHRYRQLKRRMQGFYNSASEVADVRPVSAVDWSPDGRQLVTGSWSGQCKVWDAFSLRQLCRLQEQPERVSDVAWHGRSPHIATGGVDGVARIFCIGEYEQPQQSVVKQEPSSSSSTSSSSSSASSSSSPSSLSGADGNSDAVVRLGQPFKSITERYRAGGGPGGASSSSSSLPGGFSLGEAGAAEAVMGSERSRQARYPVVAASLELKGHEDRLGRIAWHPSGRFLGTASFDLTWRLWDLGRADGACVLKQPGHIRPVYTLSFQGDGALAYTGDLGGAGYLWDLRTGRTVMPMEGHAKQVLCSDFHSNGWLLATGSDDNTVRVWDLRRRQCMYVVPAHTKMITSVRWQPDSGSLAEGCFLTASFDGSMKLWSQVDCSLLATLAAGGLGNRIMDARWAPDSESIASCSYDRTFKLWTPGYEEDEADM